MTINLRRVVICAIGVIIVLWIIGLVGILAAGAAVG